MLDANYDYCERYKQNVHVDIHRKNVEILAKTLNRLLVEELVLLELADIHLCLTLCQQRLQGTHNRIWVPSTKTIRNCRRKIQ